MTTEQILDTLKKWLIAQRSEQPPEDSFLTGEQAQLYRTYAFVKNLEMLIKNQKTKEPINTFLEGKKDASIHPFARTQKALNKFWILRRG